MRRAAFALLMAFAAVFHADASDGPDAAPLTTRLLQAPVPTDQIQASAVAEALDKLQQRQAAAGLRNYLRFRNLELLLGHEVPSATVMEAARGPWSHEDTWFYAKERFLAEGLVVDATAIDAPATAWDATSESAPHVLIAPGLWGESAGTGGDGPYRNLWLAATVANRLDIPLEASLRIVVAGSSFVCGTLRLAARSRMPVLCKSVMVVDSAMAVDALLKYKRGGDMRSAESVAVVGGTPVRTVAIDTADVEPTPAAALALRNATAAILQGASCNDTNTCEATPVDWMVSKAGITFIAVLGAMIVSVLLRLRSLASGRATGWPPVVFFGYLAFLLLVLVIRVVEPSHVATAQRPYGGLLFDVAKAIAGLPLSLAATQPGPPHTASAGDSSPVYIVAIFINLAYLTFMTFVGDARQSRGRR